MPNGFGFRGGGGRGGRGGWGFGFRGSSPPWPFVGIGRGGLPRCGYFLSGAAGAPPPPAYGSYPYYGDPGAMPPYMGAPMGPMPGAPTDPGAMPYGSPGAMPPYMGAPMGPMPGAPTDPGAMPFYGGMPQGMPYAPQMTQEQELDFLKSQAEAIKGQLEQIGNRIKELEEE